MQAASLLILVFEIIRKTTISMPEQIFEHHFLHKLCVET